MRSRKDFYETPIWQAQALRKRVTISGTVIECCSGDGSLTSQFKDCHVVTNDIDREREATFYLDATLPSSWATFGVQHDWVCTNPPFNCAMDILKLAHSHANVGVALLLRLSFMEPTKERSDWLSLNPPQQQIILPRWKYDPNSKGTDSVTTAWFVWYRQSFDIHFPPIQIVPLTEKGER